MALSRNVSISLRGESRISGLRYPPSLLVRFSAHLRLPVLGKAEDTKRNFDHSDYIRASISLIAGPSPGQETKDGICKSTEKR